MEDTDPQEERDPQQGPAPQQEGSETHRIEGMEKPYRGPEDRRGISAHGIEGETDLRRAKEYAEMIVDTVREGLLVLGFDLRIEAANESFYRMFEVAPGDTEGVLIYELGNGQWDIPELRTLLEEILPERRVMTGFEVTHTFEHIGRRVMRLNARQLDHHERILLAIEDLTEREEAEELLQASEEKLRELNRSLEKRVQKRTAELREQTRRLQRLAVELTSAEQRERRRLAALLHDDLQQLLYGAEMQLGVARAQAEQGSDLAEAIEEASKRIGEAVESARHMTRQLRPPALYEAGLTPALKWLTTDMAERHGLEVTLDADDVETSAAERALSDDIKAMLFDCARELLFNVVKYAGTGEARLALHVDAACDGPDRLRLVVEDEGRGFDADAVAEAASEEAQVSSEEAAEHAGGFGLLSIRERLAALGGSMALASHPGEGTRVELMLPLTADAAGEPAQPPPSVGDIEEGQLEERRTDVTPRQMHVRVVVADDHAVVRQGIANLLVADGRTEVVGEAADGREAVKVVEQTRPDVVLMDVNMPEMNGVEATQKIRRRWPDVAVIGLSVQADSATREAMLGAGAAAFAPKSGDVDQIIETILSVVGRS